MRPESLSSSHEAERGSVKGHVRSLTTELGLKSRNAPDVATRCRRQRAPMPKSGLEQER